MNAINATYDDYKALIKKVMKQHVSPYIESELIAADKLAEEIDAIEAAHPEYEEMLCEDRS